MNPDFKSEKREFHEPNSCNKCSKENDWLIVASDEGGVLECYTTCLHCGFEDYWAYGYFSSAEDGYDACKKYSF